MPKISGVKRSFATRLAIRLFFALVIALASVGWVMDHFLQDVAIALTKRICENNMLAMRNYTRRHASDIHVALVNHIDFFENYLDDPDKLKAELIRIVERNPNIIGCSLAFEPNYDPKSGQWLEWYASTDSLGQVAIRQIGGPSHDYLNTQWYIGARDSKDGYWSDSFYDDAGAKQVLVTYGVPIHDKHGKVVAVLGADLSLEALANYIEKMDRQIAESYISSDSSLYNQYASRSFILGRNGVYLTHKDKARILNQNYFETAIETPDTIDDRVAREMKEGKTGSAKLVLDDMPVYLFYAPVKYADWTIASVVPNDYISLVVNVVRYSFFFLMGLAILVIIFVCIVTARRITKPLERLTVSADEVAKGNFEASLPEIKEHDEIRVLRDSFENMQDSLSRYMKDLEQTTASKAAIDEELKIAYGLQMSMVPSKFPPYPNRHDIDIFGHMTPAKSVGGDLFDFFIRNEQLFFCMGDVSGKGVPAAMLMTVAKKLFRAISAHENAPEKIMAHINNTIADGNDVNMFVTLFIGRLELATGHLAYCNGGHDAPILVGKEVSLLSVKPNFPVGLMPGMSFQGEEADILPDTTIFLYTDGLTEAEDKDQNLYGNERLMMLMNRFSSKEDQLPQRLIEHTLESVHAFVGEAVQSDDLTVLAIRYFGSEQ